ncbi:MAG: Nramp family divalent metal transporter [bacterium]
MPKLDQYISNCNWRGYLRVLGPGIAIAATGVGAGDMVAAAVSGSRYGFAVIWAAVVGALLKFVLNEGLARWQLATGTTLLEGWVQRLGRWVQYYFLVYLVLWSFVVGGALISACGLAAHAIAPALSLTSWGILHSLGATAIVLIGGYKHFERLMKVFIGFMFLTI